MIILLSIHILTAIFSLSMLWLGKAKASLFSAVGLVVSGAMMTIGGASIGRSCISMLAFSVVFASVHYGRKLVAVKTK